VTFPSKKWISFFAFLALVQFLLHSGTRSPYLYYTQGVTNTDNPRFVDDMYGMAMGPNGEVIHHDVVNYWNLENLFAGKYREGSLTVILRPAYPFIVSLFSHYINHIYVSWALNLFAWVLAAVMGYALAWNIAAQNKHLAGISFAILVMSSPGYVNAIFQPMGYTFGYSVFIIYISCLVYFARSWDNSGSTLMGLVFLLNLCSFTYELLSVICVLFTLIWGFRKINYKHLMILVGSWVFLKLSWDNIVGAWVLNFNNTSAVTISKTSIGNTMHLAQSLESLNVMFISFVNVLKGYFLSSLFIAPVMSVLFLIILKKKDILLWISLTISVGLPILGMGIIFESTQSGFHFYHDGRIIAYFIVPVYLACALGAASLSDRMPGQNAIKIFLIFFALLFFTLANIDVSGKKNLYNSFNNRERLAK